MIVGRKSAYIYIFFFDGTWVGNTWIHDRNNSGAFYLNRVLRCNSASGVVLFPLSALFCHAITFGEP